MADPTYTVGINSPETDAFEAWWREFGCKLVGHPRMITRTIAEASWYAASGRTLNHARELTILQHAIRTHRDARGDDRCWMDDEDLYRLLPEGYTPPTRDAAVELDACKRFIACRHNPATHYHSPQREIERLTGERDRAIAKLISIGSVLAQP